MADWLSSNMLGMRFNAPMAHRVVNACLMDAKFSDRRHLGHVIIEGVVVGIVEFAGMQVRV